MEEAIPDLEKAFFRFMGNPVKTDPMCAAKHPILESLTKLGAANSDLFLKAARHQQWEPMWGKPEDTAATVRALGGRGLASMRYPEAMLILGELLLDREIETRRITVDTFIELGGNDAEVLLRVGALLDPMPGKEEKAPPESIVAECLSGLMRVSPDRSIEFVAGFLDRSLEEMNGAALAIGESRHLGALPILEKHWRTVNDPRVQSALLLPIALTRNEAALKFLGGVLRDADTPVALAAIDAIELFASDLEALDHIQECASGREEESIVNALRNLLSESWLAILPQN
ncbi:MAG: hypothetical protein VCD00_02340 [Candidatus Hydrogenedentota bacterium]